MKISLFTVLIIMGASLSTLAQTPTFYFEGTDDGVETQVSIRMDEGFVTGTEYSGVPEKDSAYGEITGNVRKDGLLHVTFNYTIEGSRQSEEQLMKLDGGKLYLGEGELEERGPGQMVLKDREKVKFTRALKKLPVSEPELDSAEGKAVTQALQKPLAKLTGVPVMFEGLVRISGDWALYMGAVIAAEGKMPKDEKIAAQLEQRQFQAFFKKDAKGDWKVLRSAFASPEGYHEYEGEYENAPWQLTAGLDEH